MLGDVTTLWLLLAGVCCYASLIHLEMGLRRPFDPTHLLFGALALTVALGTVVNVHLVTAETPAEYLRAAWRSSVLVTVIFMIVPLFVSQYANERRRRFALLVSTAYGVIFIGNLFHPYSMLLSGPPELTSVTLPWGDRITRSVTPATPWVKTFWAAHVLTMAYLWYACMGLFKRGPKYRAWGLTLCAVPFGATLFINILVGLKIIQFPYVNAFGFLALIILMSVVLSNEWRRSHKQMQTVLDNVPALVYLKHADGRYLFVNRQFQQFYNLLAVNIVGKTDVEIFDTQRATANRLAHEQVLVQQPLDPKRTLESEELIQRGPELRTYATSRFPLFDDDGTVYAVCGIATDVTDRKAAADVLRELAVNLERRVAHRTRDLAQVNQELEAFSYSVSHDLRAPLMSVHGFTDLLIRDHARALDQTGQKYLQRIREGATRMGALIDDLLALSRVTREQLQRVPFNLATVAQEAIRTLQETESHRQVRVDITPDLPAQGDVRLLAMVMSNLLGNAWKYTGKRTNAHIEVGCNSQDDETVYWVRDNGAGFDPKHSDRLFQPFKRLHSEQDFPGTGLGLATVARIVRRHGGRIWAEAKPQEGAVFYFTLPAPEDDASSELPPRIASSNA